MGYKLIRYSVKDTGLEENRALVTKVFETLDETAPQNVRYLVLELDDGEFVHVVGEGNDTSALTGLAAFEAFTQKPCGSALDAGQAIACQNHRQLPCA
ncbi:hypothetical protein [Mesorhizobium sp.]|uniref:hypothetical protein n=1 Tax=Mesorhizobium sp. TaxID=1871066 RepID=UPI00257FE270|nr:hypothetical protein [Mesorhizobium sp.]